MEHSLLSVFSRNLTRFQSKLEIQQQKSLRFSDISQNVAVPDIIHPPPAPTVSRIFKLYETDNFLRETFDKMIEDAQLLSNTEFGVEAFIAEQLSWETQLRDIEEDICLHSSGENAIILDCIISELYKATKREDEFSYLLAQLESILNKGETGPLLEMLNFVAFERENPGATGIEFLERCFESELKTTARYTSIGARFDVETSRIASLAPYETDASATGKTLRTMQTRTIQELTADGYSLYGRIYNCVKCGYTTEIIDLIDQNVGIDENLKHCLEELLENDYTKGIELQSYREEETDPYYHLLAQMFKPYQAEQAATPSFLEEVYSYMISESTCRGEELNYIQARHSRACIRAFILQLQGKTKECMALLYNNSLFVELFLLSIFLQDELCGLFNSPTTMESAGGGLMSDILERKRETPSTTLILTRFLDILHAREPDLVTQTKTDLMDSLLLFNHKKMRISVCIAQAYLALLRGTEVKNLNAYESHFLSKLRMAHGDCTQAVEAVILSIEKDTRAEIPNAALFYNALIGYFKMALSATELDFVRLSDFLEEFEKYPSLEEFERENLEFLIELLETKIQFVRGRFDPEGFDNLQFKGVDPEFFQLVKDEVIQSVFWIVGQFHKYNVKYDIKKIKDAIVLFHSIWLSPEEERMVVEMEALLQ